MKFFDDTVEFKLGNMLEVLKEIPDNTFDACVTDPPYHLSTVKRFGSEDAAPAKYGTDGLYKRASTGFMGKTWDGGEIAFNPETWLQVLRVLKPGAHMFAFAAPRNQHRMICAIEDAGFEVRDCVLWLYGTGFPKSHNVSKALDKLAGAERGKVRYTPRPITSGTIAGSSETRPCIEKSREVGYHETDDNNPISEEAKKWDGWGTALKPAYEPICLARKPLSEKSVAENVLKWGTGAINIDACRVGGVGGMGKVLSQKGILQSEGGWGTQKFIADDTIRGRFPANIIHDGSDEVLEGFPNAGGGYGKRGNNPNSSSYGFKEGFMQTVGYGDEGSAARFFYTAKASKKERAGSKHPTVKPLSLTQYLVRMITPPGGYIIDPFAGSGTTGEAAHKEGMRAYLVDMEENTAQDLAARESRKVK